MNEQSTPVTVQSQVPSKAPSIIALVLGILALLCGILTFISVPLGIAAIILGVIGIKKKAGKGMAIGGIVTGSIGLITGLLIAPLLVFLAVPALQKNQGDIQVKNDVSVAVSAVNSFRSENQGALPSEQEFASSNFKNLYLSEVETSLEYRAGTDCEGNSGELFYSVRATLSTGNDYCLSI